MVHTFDMKRVNQLIKESDPCLQNYILALKEISNNWEQIAKQAISKLKKTKDNYETQRTS
jgi:hypothetical protein